MLTVASGRRVEGGILEASPEICSGAFQLGGVAGGWGLPRVGVSRWSPRSIKGSPGGEQGRAHSEQAAQTGGPALRGLGTCHPQPGCRTAGYARHRETCLPPETLL